MREAASAARPRLVDIAEAAGVHVSTVSRVLNGDTAKPVRAETRDRILSVARRRGYRPNALARALRASRTGAVAMVVPMLTNPVWSVIQRGALDRAAERDCSVLVVAEPTEQPREPASYAELVEESRVDGLVLGTTLRPQRGLPTALNVPHVYLNRRGPRPGNNVVMDEEGAVALLLQETLALGRRGVLLLDGPTDVDTVHRRTVAFRRQAPGLGLRARVVHAPADEDGGFTVAAAELAAGRLPGVVGVGSLPQLYGVVAALRNAGVRVPADVVVVSFDEDESLRYLGVPVASVSMPLRELGAAAVDALLAQVAGGPANDVLVSGPMSLLHHAART